MGALANLEQLESYLGELWRFCSLSLWNTQQLKIISQLKAVIV